MRVAHIYPHSFLWRYVTGENRSATHMILPCNLTNNKYASFYGKAQGFKMLDNGAAEPEGWQPTDSQLISTAEGLKVHEVVCPDVMGDAVKTLERTHEFGKRARDTHGLNFAGVVHAESMQEAHSVIGAYMYMPWITTICLPRCLAKTMDDKYARINILLSLTEAERDRFQIHLLGAHDFIDEVIEVPRWVRSIDTSAPIVLAKAGIDIRNTEFAVGVRRSEDYFEWDPKDESEIMFASENCRYYEDWCR